MRIEQLQLHNFKGITDMSFSMSDASAIILGGKNGYGKTTIFDALELILTGRIERYSNYEKKFIDHRRSLNDVEMPLVCQRDIPDVSVALVATYHDSDGEHRAVLTRRARVAEMSNPVDFGPFKQLFFSKDSEDIHPITDEEQTVLGLDSLAEAYGIIMYLSQEESTLFVKSSDSDRAESIQYLFNTKRFDDRIEKIDKLVAKGIKSYADEIIVQQDSIKARIEDLKKYHVEQEPTEETAYLPLFADNAQIGWDKAEPALGNEEYQGLLAEHGVIDGLLNLVSHWDDVRKFRKSKSIDKILEKSGDYAYYWLFRSKLPMIRLWKDFQDKTVKPFDELELYRIDGYSLYIPAGLGSVINLDEKESLIEFIKHVKALYKSATLAERAYNEMLDQRNRLEAHLRGHAEQMAQTTCPLCGQSYEDERRLLESIQRTTRLQQESNRVFSAQAVNAFLKMQEMLRQTIINPIQTWFNEQGISKEVAESVLNLDIQYLEPRISKLIEKGYITEQPESDARMVEGMFRKAMEDGRESFDTKLDYGWLSEIYQSYGKLMREECRQKAPVMQKRAYLLRQWSSKKSTMMERLLAELKATETKRKTCEDKGRKLKELRDELERQKNAWLKQVITDVEILFYIYSGRIMQDNFFGRGLFMKTEPGKYIYFVSDPQSEVDALYKLSSGQLVALMMSLLLSLNKLYAREKFIAIDDPVQTIDDINVWGFVETLRHEFRDYQLLFSTHELGYGSFLRYKLSKMGIATEYKDMLSERQK